MKRLFLAAVMLTVCSVLGFSAPTMVEIPGIGEVGFEKVNKTTYKVSVPKFGTYEYQGYFKSKNDFDLKVTLPAGEFTDKIPAVGQILGLLGLDTVSLRVTPKGLGIAISLESGGLGALRGKVTEALGKVKALRIAIDAIISQLEIKSFVLDGMIDGGTLKGKLSGDISVIGKSLKFDVDGEISFKRILDGITDKIIPAVKDFVTETAKKYYAKTKELAKKVGAAAANKAKALYGAALKVAKDVASSMKHSTHSLDKCLKECTPKYANPQGQKMLESAKGVFNEFVNSIYNDVLLIEGNNTEETKNLRLAVFLDEWMALEKEVDDGWQKMYKDDYVKNFALKDSSEKKLYNKYKEIIKGYWDQFNAYKQNLGNKLMYDIKP